MKIDFMVKEDIGGCTYKLEVYSSDGENFRVCENNQNYLEYDNRSSFARDFPEAARWIFGDTL